MTKEIFIEEIDDKRAIRITFDYDRALVRHTKKLAELGVDRSYRKTPYKHWWVEATPFNAARVIEHFDGRGFSVAQEVEDIAGEEEIEVSSIRQERDHPDLYDYQIKAVNFIDETGGRCLVADEMGLGKTVETLDWIRRHDDEIERVAVICPANVAYKWRREIVRWIGLNREHVSVLRGFDTPWPEETPFIVSSYTTMAERFSEFVAWEPDVFIADECHYLKNHKAKRTRAAKHINTVAKYFIALSGTPFLNRPMEMFNVLNMIDSTEWSNAWAFGNRYAGGKFGHVEDGSRSKGYFKGRTNTEELRERLGRYMIRRLKTDVLDELPDITRSLIPLDIPNMDEYNRVREFDHENVLVKIGALWRTIGKGKASAATSWINDFFQSNDVHSKLVVKCHHVEVAKALERALDKYNPVAITGEVAGDEREARIDAYQSPGGPRVIIISEAGAQGIDLFGIEGVDSSNILFVEREWSPANEEQAEGRLHRKGQKNAVEAHYLVAKGTIDEYMAQVIDSKRKGIKDVVGLHDPETTVKEAVAHELQA